jgi:hypothetical protein
VLADQARLKRAVPIARHVDRQRAVVGQHGFAARAMAMIGAIIGLHSARRVAEVVGQLAA